jgi:zinc-ribbon domain
MREGHRFCGHCGHELKPAARFCADCGHSVPQNADQAAARGSGQDSGARAWQRPDPSAFAPTVTSGPGRPPPPARSGAGPPRRGTPPGQERRPAFPWPLTVALFVLAAGVGTAAALFLTRHSAGQPSGGQENVAAVTPTTPPPSEVSASASPAPPPTQPAPPPAQVALQGITIGIGAVNTDPDATDVATTLAAYFGGIDMQNYEQAWDTYTSALQAAVPYQPWASALSTTQDGQVTVQGIQHEASGNIDADVSFQSHQAGRDGPNPGETCTNWTLDYQMVPAPGATAGSVSLSYQINAVKKIGAGHVSC